MGNSSLTKGDNLRNEIMDQYKEIKKDANGTIILERNSQLTYLMKEFNFAGQQLFGKQKKKMEGQMALGRQQNILSIVQVEEKTFSSFCSTCYKLYVVYEYPQVTLKDEIQARSKQSKNFDEGQLWSILQSCTNALSQLKPTLSLTPQFIFINPDGQLKVIHNDMIEENYRLIINRDYYYAPEKITGFNKADNEITMLKQVIFSMGMTILSTALLLPLHDCYDYEQQIFLSDELDLKLLQLEGRYSQDFSQILGILLEVDPENRASSTQVQRVLDNYWQEKEKNESNEQPQMGNGQSLNIRMGQSQKISALNQQSENVLFRNLNTVSSNQKDSLRSQFHYSKFPKFLNKQSIQMANFNSSKENIYTDPKLLQMIRKDLEDISKLKKSALYETDLHSMNYYRQVQSVKELKELKGRPETTLDQRVQKNSVSVFESLVKERKEGPSHNTSIVVQNFPQFRQMSYNRQSYIDHHNSNMRKNIKQNEQGLAYSVVKYKDGRKYEGYMRDGKKNGRGKLTFQDGAFYEGEFKQDKMNGKGVLFYYQGLPAYDGDWFEDKFHGYGILYNECPQKLTKTFDYSDFSEVDEFWVRYEGNFDMDNKSGYGKLVLSNGQIIEGNFQEDRINGECKFTNFWGESVNGQWQFNRLVSLQNN